MSDIVNRLRNRIHDAPMPTERMLDEAADEIERLRTALKRIAAFKFDGEEDDADDADTCADIALAALNHEQIRD